ncbi:MAG: DNA recombination protein RmuC [Pseudomonadota bacterium]|nr:DNA recombination protein RmuC [Pseudomonadota bacterium]
MEFENTAIYLLTTVVIIWLFLQFFFSNNNTKERIKILLEKQESLEKSISELIEKNFDKIDLKFDRSSSENISNLSQIREKMSLIDRAQQNITSLTENVIDLKNFLSNTTQRGRFGEILLENLVKDYLPKDHYEFQKTLSNNSRVDCMIKSSGSLDKLCIDAKFPKESYDKLQKSTTKDEKTKYLKTFRSDINNHILSVKEKYIISGETSEFALIFIPSEQIYLEIFRLFPDISENFYDNKTFLISPTTLWIILNSIESLIRDKKIQNNSTLIFQQLKDLSIELIRLENRVKKMDSHFSNAQNYLNEVLITTKKITNKKEQLLKLDDTIK